MTGKELEIWSSKDTDVTITYSYGFGDDRPTISKTGNDDDSVLDISVGDSIRVEGIEIDDDQTIDEDHRIDYGLAAASGVLSAAVDSLFVRSFSLDNAESWGSEKINNFVVSVAKLDSKFKGNSIEEAIPFLEKRHPFVGDKATAQFGGGLQHHLRDFSHHFGLDGLAFSLLTQFTGCVYGTDTHGVFQAIKIVDDKGLIGKTLEKKIFNGTVEWFLHMVSDMAGSSNNPGEGTGIPGPILSILKDISTLPIFKDGKVDSLDFRKLISKLFNGTLLDTINEQGRKEPRRLDFRGEFGVAHELGRQAIPVVLNIVLVRVCYVLHRLYQEIKNRRINDFKELRQLEISDIPPDQDSVLTRMDTIASATFELLDVTDASIRTVLENGLHAEAVQYLKSFVVRINLAGVTYLTISIVTDAKRVLGNHNEERKQRQKERDEEYAKNEERAFAAFTLTHEQMSILYSLERCAVKVDIEHTKNAQKRNAKEAWLDEWQGKLAKEFSLYDEDEMYRRVDSEVKRSNEEWIHVVALEAALFTPYADLGNHASRKKESSDETRHEKHDGKLPFDNAYLDDIWCVKCPVMHEQECSRLKKTFEKYKGIVSGSNKHKAIEVAGTVALISVGGGAALIFAPVIAPAVAAYTAGSAVAGLSGAALTSASLAALGGGSLAVGGLGMAGGTAVIAGGGAVLGMLGAGGSLTAASMVMGSSDTYILDECSKLLTVCKEILSDTEERRQVMMGLQARLDIEINQLENYFEMASQLSKQGKQQGRSEQKTDKAIIKRIKKSLRYLKKTAKELQKLLDEENADSSLPELTTDK
ncbi:hypothetical protein OZX67_01725 [Bifidobacterium sp. ESL0728]|uniref:hypothetical protein n=1 Tax=Bifidobacterium sp. ESL0728 TaxID=2983220 RepID=UPI0023F65403|nr:hypothetical protein [Bifidobacterium sp. ESL0728]WEV59313.1 hypothetical protein OZX67_01725 [Bifidobacterium sp. ESL0728]